MFESLIEDIEIGIRGENVWIPIQYDRLGTAIVITQRMYHLVGGDPGTGKTAFVDQTYVLNAYDWVRKQDKVKYNVIYFSMERSKKYKQAKFLAHRLYTENNIIMDVPSLLGWGIGKFEVTPEIMQTIRSHKEYFDEMYKNVEIIDGANNPTGIYKALKRRALENGIIYQRDGEGQYYKETLESWLDNKKIKISESSCPVKLVKWDKRYVPDDPDLITLVVLDHIGKMKEERGFTKKQIIDKTSEYLGEARDLYGNCIVLISQFNRNNANIQRRIHTDLTPEQQDFKDSGNTYEDADVVLGLFNPDKHGLKTYKEYNINWTKNNIGVSRFRSVSILKNSYGIDSGDIGFKFIGENGLFKELPKASQMKLKENYEEIINV